MYMRLAVEKLKQGEFCQALNWVLWELRDRDNEQKDEWQEINQQHYQERANQVSAQCKRVSRSSH